MSPPASGRRFHVKKRRLLRGACTQVAERNSVVRKLQIMKLRGQDSVPGLHTIRISDDGLQAFSRTLGLVGKRTSVAGERRLSVGVPELDKMLGGGICEGDSLLVAGPSGTGKSALATQFIDEEPWTCCPSMDVLPINTPLEIRSHRAARKELSSTRALRPRDQPLAGACAPRLQSEQVFDRACPSDRAPVARTRR